MKALKLAIIIIVSLSGCDNIKSRSPKTHFAQTGLTWEQTYRGMETTKSFDFVAAIDDAYYIAGQKNNDFWISKTSSKRHIVWERTFGDPNVKSKAYSIVLAKDHNLVVVGNIDSVFNGFPDALFLKLNQNGEVIWRKQYRGVFDNVPLSIIRCKLGGFIAAGYINTPYSAFEAWVIRLDENGNLIWEKQFGGNGIDKLTQVIQVEDGSFIVAGESNSTVSHAEDYNITPEDIEDSQESDSREAERSMSYLANLDDNGKIIWEKRFKSKVDERMLTIIPLDDGHIAAVGEIIDSKVRRYAIPRISLGSPTSIWVNSVLEINSSSFYYRVLDMKGDTVLEKKHESRFGYITPSSLVRAADNSIYLAANKILGNLNGVVIKFDVEGNITWEKEFGGGEKDYISSIKTDKDGIPIFTGSYSNIIMKGEYNYSRENAWIAKLEL